MFLEKAYFFLLHFTDYKNVVKRGYDMVFSKPVLQTCQSEKEALQEIFWNLRLVLFIQYDKAAGKTSF